MKALYISFLILLLPINLLAQWEWQNQLPEWNTLKNLFVVDSLCIWATGDSGSIAFTEDGEIWHSYKDLGTTENLGGIFFISKQIGWLVTCSSDKVYKTTDGGNNWELISSLGFNLINIAFTDQQNGFITGEDFIAKTTDGGFNWNNVFELTGSAFNHISLLDTLECWVASGSTIFRSTNGGGIWEEQNTGITGTVSGLQIINKDTGWVSIERSILRTTNGGGNWIEQYTAYNSLTALFMLDTESGWAIDSPYGVVYVTHNSGINWLRVSPDQDLGDINSIAFYDVHRGWALDNLGRILYSTNSGSRWTIQSSGTTRQVNGISFSDSLNGLAVAQGLIYRTTNGGKHWYNTYWDDTYLFRDVDLYDSLYGFTVGFCDEYFSCTGGITMKTTNGGIDWINLYPWGYQDIYGFSCSYFLSRNVVYVGGDEAIRKTTDFGISWEDSEIEGNILDISFIDSSNGWAAGRPQVVFKTTNSGNNWDLILTGNYGIIYTNLVFLNNQVGYITEPEGQGLLKSLDGGYTWFETGYPGADIVFADSLYGWLLGNNKLYKTTDGGIHWEILSSIPTTHSVSEMAVIDRKYIWVAGINGTILKYTDTLVTSLETENNQSLLPYKFALSQNYPNPFNPSTKIKYTIAQPNLPQGEAFVTLKVYDVLGREVATLVNEEKPPDSYEVEFDGSNLPSGVYFYRLRAGSYLETKKMILIK